MPAKRSTISARAMAKINLSLRVLGVRGDGYHEVRTVFQSIALHDTLNVGVGQGPFRLECDDPACPTDQTNLVWRAAEKLWTASGRRGAPQDTVVTLVKRIPMQAGLGGGSSDAAVALVALSKLWRIADADLAAIGASLGADVPYFLEGGSVLGLDRGDVLFPLADAPARWVALAVPDFGVSTKDAYGWLDYAPGGPGAAAAGDRTPDGIRNDLQAAVARQQPEIARLVTALLGRGADAASMTGSGSAVFGLFARRPDAERALRALAGRSCRTVVTRTVNRAAYQRLAGIPAHRINFPFAPRGVSRI
jgi:4-diphosphocytidyl-2-C-methyl-D-erythritol kinase